MDYPTITYTLKDGRELTITLSRLTQANGEALVRLGDTMVLVTATMGSSPREGVGFFPLSVEFEEKYYASGRLRKSRFVKREAKPPESAFLAARLIDRTIRPQFPKGMRNDVQIVVTVLSYDDKHDPDVLGLLGASTALSLSDIPWNGPVAGVRVAQVNETPIINPSEDQRAEARFDVIVAGVAEAINMLEGDAKEISDNELVEAIDSGHAAVKELITAITEGVAPHAKEKTAVPLLMPDENHRKTIRDYLGDRLEKALFSGDIDKSERMARVNEIKQETMEHFTESDLALESSEVGFFIEDEIDRLVHAYALEKDMRVDGRALDEVRALDIEVGVLPSTHGSALFTRGETRALGTITLAGPGEEQLIEGMEGESTKPFMLHYNFPPYSVGDTKPMRGPGRREIGHGMLAERSLAAVTPSREKFPYTIRVASEILSSNGSSSMATVCTGSLALMDAGVPVSRHVTGIAMGIMLTQQPEGEKQAAGSKEPDYRILTDIQGPEDHHGDMDLKIAGTREGITGLQMDVKVNGVSLDMLKDAFAQARKAHAEILDAMERVIPEPRASVASYAPKVAALKINPDKIRDLIGPGGKVINSIIDKTGVSIDVEDNGEVYVTGIDADALDEAVKQVEAVTQEAEVGDTFEGEITRLFPFGAMVEIFPGQEGLVHMSTLGKHRHLSAEQLFKTGSKVAVRVKEIDDKGRLNLELMNPQKVLPDEVPQASGNGRRGKNSSRSSRNR